MAEVHLVGTLLGAHAPTLLSASTGLACKYALVAGPAWTVIEGTASAQTHVDVPSDGEWAVWSHPLDVHFATRSLHAWPKLVFEVVAQDALSRMAVAGYGLVQVPMAPGTYRLECTLWRPACATWVEALKRQFLGVAPALKSLDAVAASADRAHMVTESVPCTVHVEVSVIHRGLAPHGVHVAASRSHAAGLAGLG
ncbi:B9 domain-containing protein 2 [Allomyces javanicus]|nr:B9 domain-containing protein 2 [Allomyces javanicus]